VFHHEGPARSTRKNAVLAGYLAFVAGFVNTAGFVMLGLFTSHVTGAVGRLGVEVALHDPGAPSTLALIGAFFGGAVAASLLLEAHLGGRKAISYGLALLLEATLLAIVALRSERIAMAAMLLSAAMGMQNSLVTRLSGAVVRTTHLTGVLTDLGIEAARWMLWVAGGPTRPAERPKPSRGGLLLIIALAFAAGAILGATLASRYGRWVLAAPACAVAAASLFAFLVSGRHRDPTPASTSTSSSARAH